MVSKREVGHRPYLNESLLICSSQCEEDMVESVEPDSDQLEEILEAPVAMQDTDLRSMKDALLIEASQILGVCNGYLLALVFLSRSCPFLFAVTLSLSFLTSPCPPSSLPGVYLDTHLEGASAYKILA